MKDFSIKNLPQPAQFIIFAALIGCLAFAYYRFYLTGQIKARDTIQAEIVKLEPKVAQKKAAEAQYKQFKEAIDSSQEQLLIRQKMLPTEKETPILLRNIQKMATSSNLRLDKFVPKPMIPRDYYSDWPIQMEVQGNYNGLGQFFEKIGRANRIINVGTLSIKGIEKQTDPTQTLTASCTATTFVFNNSSTNSQAMETQKEKKR